MEGLGGWVSAFSRRHGRVPTFRDLVVSPFARRNLDHLLGTLAASSGFFVVPKDDTAVVHCVCHSTTASTLDPVVGNVARRPEQSRVDSGACGDGAATEVGKTKLAEFEQQIKENECSEKEETCTKNLEVPQQTALTTHEMRLCAPQTVTFEDEKQQEGVDSPSIKLDSPLASDSETGSQDSPVTRIHSPVLVPDTDNTPLALAAPLTHDSSNSLISTELSETTKSASHVAPGCFRRTLSLKHLGLSRAVSSTLCVETMASPTPKSCTEDSDTPTKKNDTPKPVSGINDPTNSSNDSLSSSEDSDTDSEPQARKKRLPNKSNARIEAPAKRRRVSSASKKSKRSESENHTPATECLKSTNTKKKKPQERKNFVYAGVKQNARCGRLSTKKSTISTHSAPSMMQCFDSANETEFLMDSEVFDEGGGATRSPTAQLVSSPADVNLEDILREQLKLPSFRPCQKEAITRVISLQSTLVITPTGSGKSLCYQLPALILSACQAKSYLSFVLVVTPLLSLIADQLLNLPAPLVGASLHSKQSKQETAAICEGLRAGQIHILFVAPERVVTSSFIKLTHTLPPISFVCVDEAHCVSVMSHNFRPCYLRLSHVIRKQIGVNCILALTATATRETEKSICDLLQIAADGVIRNEKVISGNVTLSCSCEVARMTALTSLLQSPEFRCFQSIIIYCMSQSQSEELAHMLQSHSFNADCYHAGKTMTQRNHIQDLFLANKLQIIVATVAFGMGINKKNVQAVIHFYLPRSIENYIQEVGRAGRDGNPARCHIFISEEDFLRIRSFSFSDTVEDAALKRFLDSVYKFPGKRMKRAEIKYNSFSLDLAQELKQEILSTVLAYMEQGGFIQILDVYFKRCQLQFFKSTPEQLAEQWPLCSTLVSISKKEHAGLNQCHEFDLASACNESGYTLSDLLSELGIFQGQKEITCKYVERAIYVKIIKVPTSMDTLFEEVANKIHAVEMSKVSKVTSLYNILKNNCFPTFQESLNSLETSPQLQAKFSEYFTAQTSSPDLEITTRLAENQRVFLVCDVKVFLSQFDNEERTKISSYAVARVFQGIPSADFPEAKWCTNSFWGKYTHLDFLEIANATKQVLSKMAQCE
ncbi:ATP-dependent DNA helicase Q 5 [Pelomyxa schiedti]|nr:ATP-dependent DNA helicase Q 5 [Pelomyxa schiedti]